MVVGAKRYLRQAAYRGYEFKRWGFLLSVAFLIAGGQGLYELYDKDLGIGESIEQVNWTWFSACVITFFGVFLTSDLVWKFVRGPRATEARIEAALRMAALSCNLGERANVRAAVFVAYLRGKERVLFQEFPYVYAHCHESDYGPGEHGQSEAIGIIGHLMRHEADSFCSFLDNSDEEKFRDLLISAPWNFPKMLAYEIDRSRADYMGIRFSRLRPNGTKIEGVLYFDARVDTESFDDDIALHIINEQLGAIADYVAEHFKKG